MVHHLGVTIEIFPKTRIHGLKGQMAKPCKLPDHSAWNYCISFTSKLIVPGAQNTRKDSGKVLFLLFLSFSTTIATLILRTSAKLWCYCFPKSLLLQISKPHLHHHLQHSFHATVLPMLSKYAFDSNSPMLEVFKMPFIKKINVCTVPKKINSKQYKVRHWYNLCLIIGQIKESEGSHAGTMFL